MNIIKVKDLVFEYYQRNDTGDVIGINTALDNMNIEVEKGDFVAILGHNGSGKSTFAKHLNVLLKATEGALWIKGLDASDNENTYEIRKNVGMVFQNPDNQIIATVVEEDIAFGLENIGFEQKKMRERVDYALDKVNLMEYSKSSPDKLSGGQKQRVAIAGILAIKPECIVLDEATAMIDPQGRKDVLNTITTLNKQENITVIYITHYMEEVIGADIVYVMDNGTVVMKGTPREIFSKYEKLKELKLDVPQITELAHMLSKEGINIPNNLLTINEMVDAICNLL